jgi:hypothetical protein
MNTKNYAIYNLTFGVIFLIFFGGVTSYGGFSLFTNKNHFEIINAIFILIIGMLGVVEGIRVFIKGYKYITSSDKPE